MEKSQYISIMIQSLKKKSAVLDTIMELNIFFKKILCRQLTIYQDTESYTINGTLSDTISDITDLILSFSA